MRGIYYNPVIFFAQPSLFLNLVEEENYIKTTSVYINFYMKVDKKDGKFLIKDYPGVIASTTDMQDEIKVEGSLKNVNKVL